MRGPTRRGGAPTAEEATQSVSRRSWWAHARDSAKEQVASPITILPNFTQNWTCNGHVSGFRSSKQSARTPSPRAWRFSWQRAPAASDLMAARGCG